MLNSAKLAFIYLFIYLFIYFFFFFFLEKPKFKDYCTKKQAGAYDIAAKYNIVRSDLH